MLLIIKNKIKFQFNENFNIFIQHQGLLGAVVRNVKEMSSTKNKRGRNIVRNPQCHGNQYDDEAPFIIKA